MCKVVGEAHPLLVTKHVLILLGVLEMVWKLS